MIDFLSSYAAIIGLLFFVMFFGVVIFWTLRPSAKDEYKKNAYIPLEEND